MKLSKEWKATITKDGESASFFFRNPSNEEINDFLSERYAGDAESMFRNGVDARCEFFDRLLTHVEDLVGEDGTAITGPDRAAEIPREWKAPVIFKQYESHRVDVKN